MAERTVTCFWCNGEFTAIRKDAKYCSRRCCNRANYSYTPTDNTRACEWCGQTFKPKRADARYCSQRCFYGPRSRQGYGPQRSCDMCGTDISDRMGNAKFCHDCYPKRPQAVHEANRRAKRPWYGTCKGCGTAIRSQSQFCSVQCAGQSNRRKQLATELTRTCRGCGETFTTRDVRSVTCGTACRQWIRSHPGVKRVLDRECLHCGTPFRASMANHKYCFPTCTKSAAKIRRRGQLARVFVEDVRKTVIAERDRWTCQLCGKKVNQRLRAPHPKSWSIDHIVPIYRGGEHSYANTQLAHLGCNVAKGHRTRHATQLALIG